MKFRSLLGAVFLAFVLLFPTVLPLAQSTQAQDPEWEEVAPGIQYRLYTLPTPNRVFVARMDRKALDVTLDTSIAMGKLASGRETVLNMARRYDGALNYWGESQLDENNAVVRNPGWGTTNRVAVAVNGFYFNPTTGYPIQGLVHSGWYARRFDNCEFGTGGSGFAWNLDGNAFIGESVRDYVSTYTYDADGKIVSEQRFLQQFVTHAAQPERQVTLDGLNRSRGDGEIILYTPQYDLQTLTPITGTEMLVELTKPAMIAPSPTVIDTTTINETGKIVTQTVTGLQHIITGTVKSIQNQGSSLIPFDHVVVSAGGLVSQGLSENFQAGDVISITQTVLKCGDAGDYNWGSAYTSIGGAYYFLRNGVIYPFSDKREANWAEPRTAVAFNEEFVFFIVVDGRDPYWSVGMSIGQLASFAKEVLGADYGIAEDGGGSSTMVVNGVVVNNTLCNNIVCKSKSFLPVLVRPEPEAGLNTVPTASSEQQVDEALLEAAVLADPYARLVSNGLLMVAVEPAQRSQKFFALDAVSTISAANVRLGPGLNYAAFTSVEGNTNGVVVEHISGLNGIYAKGNYWWKIRFGENGPEGWVSESLLRPGLAP